MADIIDKIENSIARTIVVTFRIFIYTVGVFLIFGLLLGLNNGTSESLMYKSFGWGGILITGFIGTPIHEFGHYIMCKLFGIDVIEVSWFRPIQGQTDGQLGYVKFAVDKSSFIQQMGCFFVGIAPLIIGTLLMIVLFRILLGDKFRELMSSLTDQIRSGDFKFKSIFSIIWRMIKSILTVPYKQDKKTVIKYIVFILLMFSISTHMKLSLSDFNGASKGIWIIVAIMFVIAVIVELLKKNIRKTLIKIAAVITSFFSISVVFSLISLTLSLVLYLIKSAF